MSSKQLKKKRLMSARPRETYLDQKLKKMNQRLPSKEDVYRGIFHATNRYKGIDDENKENLHKNFEYKSNLELLKEKFRSQSK